MAFQSHSVLACSVSLKASLLLSHLPATCARVWDLETGKLQSTETFHDELPVAVLQQRAEARSWRAGWEAQQHAFSARPEASGHSIEVVRADGSFAGCLYITPPHMGVEHLTLIPSTRRVVWFSHARVLMVYEISI